MVKGRKVGQVEITVKELHIIVEMTKNGDTRKDIAKQVNRSYNTVYRYQKKLNLM